MDRLTAQLEARFGSFPEPVMFLSGDQILYANEPGEPLRHHQDLPLLFALAEHPGGGAEITLGQDIYRVTVSPFAEGDLLVLRPMEQPEERRLPFSNALPRMRSCLSDLTFTRLRMEELLEERGLEETFQRPIADQTRLMFQMLRLIHHAELTQDLDEGSFPRDDNFDLAAVFQGMCDETAMLVDLAGVTLTYSSNTDYLPFRASKSLISAMLASLVSNAVRAAGREGRVEMKLRAENGRVVISLRDSGAGIPEDRMPTLFSGQVPEGVPRPGEGAGLGLYNARRIAALHGGVLVAQSSLEGGTAVVVSLPIVKPPNMSDKNHLGYDNLGGYSLMRIELSDLLPWQAYVKKDDEFGEDPDR